MESISKRNSGISLCRIIATFMIIICHLGTAYGYSSIGQFFQSGVQIFLFLSGLLYSEKNINNIKSWMLGRWKRVSIPCYLYSIIVVIICIVVKESFSIIGLIEIIFNVEGYHHIFTFLPNVWILPGTAHFWFITVILLCYCMVAIIKHNNWDRWFCKNRNKLTAALLVLSVFSGLFGLRLDFFFIFLLGYSFAKGRNKALSNRCYVISIILFVLAVGLRLLGKKYCDIYGDNALYLYVVIPYTYNAIALAIYIFIKKIDEKVMSTKNGYSDRVMKLINIFDSLSFYVFIVHYIFIDGPVSLIYITPYVIINISITIFVILVASIILKKISEYIIFHFDRQKE